MLQYRIKVALLPPQDILTKSSLPFKSTSNILRLGENHSGPTVTSDNVQYGRMQTMAAQQVTPPIRRLRMKLTMPQPQCQ
jgi:hypothetical protein